MSGSCLTGNYTFVDEAGHVAGTRHDNDPTTSPFSYGHGFVMSSISRTVMAVNNGPCSGLHPRRRFLGAELQLERGGDRHRELQRQHPRLA